MGTSVASPQTAGKPEFQDPACRGFFESGEFQKSFESQYGQDLHTFYNYFIQKGPGYRGFYVDLAAAYPKSLSNTYFFDKCLGWHGLCIEGSPERAENLRKERSCIVENIAVTAEDNVKVKFSVPTHNMETAKNGVVGNSKDESGIIIEVDAWTLRTVLERNDVRHIDYLSLDIEGLELAALKTMDTGAVTVDTMTVEVNDDVTHDYITSLGFERHKGTLRCGDDCYWADSIYTGSNSDAGTMWKDHHPDSIGKPIPSNVKTKLEEWL